MPILVESRRAALVGGTAMSRERTLDEQLIMLRLAARVDPLLREAVADVDDAVATLTTRAEQAEARVAALEAALTSLWMHKPGDCDACNKLIAGRASG
jgi:hypothetical protein